MLKHYLALFALFSFYMMPAANAQTTFVDEDAEIRFGGGNLEQGKNKARSALCVECHGDAVSAENMGVGVPRLNGQYAGYLLKQLSNFKSGERKHVVMNKMVEDLNDDDLQDIATYFASQPIMQGKGGVNTDSPSLFIRGDAKRNIMSCKSCHGIDGKGSHSANDINPVIAGQSQIYLREQLRNWRSATRTNSPSQVMNVIAESLTDAEIEALSAYIADMQ